MINVKIQENIRQYLLHIILDKTKSLNNKTDLIYKFFYQFEGQKIGELQFNFRVLEKKCIEGNIIEILNKYYTGNNDIDIFKREINDILNVLISIEVNRITKNIFKQHNYVNRIFKTYKK